MSDRSDWFRLEMATDNAAFGDNDQDTREEIARILRETATRIERGVTRGRLLDANGNTVGSFSGAEHGS